MKKRIYSLILIVIALFVTTACGVKDQSDNEKEISYKEITEGTLEDIKYKTTEEITNYVKIQMKNNDIIIVELYPKTAPITVANFQKLVSEKYYDDIIFHRVIKDFMIQAGDPTGTGMGGAEETIKGEFAINDVTNTLSHKRGIISMARKSSDPETEYTMNSASSQFFIVHKDSTFLDTKYASFGNVLAGMDTVDSIVTVKTDSKDKPTKDQTIGSIRFVEIEK